MRAVKSGLQGEWLCGSLSVALNRPYTFIVLALLILILSPVVILRTPTDIFPNINIPVIAVAWQYTGLNPEEMEGRLTSVYERSLTTTVDNIEHIESTTVDGQAIVRIFLQPGASLDTANAQVTAISQTILRQLPPGTLPPLVINYSASSVPVLQLGLSGTGLSEQELNDIGQNFMRPQLVTVPGAVVPWPYGGKQRQVMIDLNPGLLQSKGLSPQDVLNSVGNQNLVLPSGTAKIDQFEYDVRMNSSPQNRGGAERPSHQAGRPFHGLPPRCWERPRRLRAANEHRARRWTSRSADQHHESRQRLDD